MAKRKATFTVEVEYDDEHTDDESLATVLDILMNTATSTPGIFSDYGDVSVGEFYPATYIPPDVKF